jgi:DNA-binding NarL/FixJ family response regulator
MNPSQNETRILLVDDHQMMRQGLRQLLAVEPGLIVVGDAGNGQSAREQVRALSPHLVLMDIHLRDESGVEITRQMLAEFPAVKVIALSSDSAVELVLQALRAGVAGYLLKENGADELVRAIHTVMDHRLYLSPAVSSAVILQFMESSSHVAVGPAGADLTERERMLLLLIAAGNRNKEMAAALAVTVKSVETYRSRFQKKLGCAGTAELVRYAIREGIAKA